ncbi:uncharacterized protein BDW43DRAFT_259772 [Aspergillus alliaceus]|uniref:uncharacterized protein n=1 Tax=Petromyces alliaceus TaxID=209559 RepID=UPI0012A5E063|nr:uncharacterized protein BDW43DRAFT_259772 [Aspergillus alliaceus]KAB8238777.1 hypothetical protein BDW43DRAFT_259772 [Aspergillus alliaceus]
MEMFDLTTGLEGKIPILAKLYGGKLKHVLKGPDAAFTKAKDEFLGHFEACVNIFMEESYAPDEVSKREEVVQNRRVWVY